MENYNKSQGLQDTVLSLSKRILLTVSSGVIDVKGIDSSPSSAGEEWEGHKLLQLSRTDPKGRLKSQTFIHLCHCARVLWPHIN